MSDTDKPPSRRGKTMGETYQKRVNDWVVACFGEEVARDGRERNHRFLEEALELVQAAGCTSSEAHQLVDYVFGRDVGEPGQEVGGVMNTLAALCTAHRLDLNAEAERELARVWTKVEAIRAKHARKPKHSPLGSNPMTADTTPSPECMRCAGSGLIAMGNGQYDNCPCGAWSNLTPEEQKAQAARCSCKGCDDYCPCQNTPDSLTRAQRATVRAGYRYSEAVVASRTAAPEIDWKARAEAAEANARRLSEAARDVLALPASGDAVSILKRGIGTKTAGAAWLRLIDALEASTTKEADRGPE